MKLLLVGDLHLKKENQEESQPLLDKIARLSQDHDYTVLFGDLFNDHGVIRSDVLGNAIEFLKKTKNAINIEGNHDVLGDGKSSILIAIEPHVYKNISKPTVLDLDPLTGEHVGFIPFMRSPEEFVETAKQLGSSLIFCHQEFDVSIYENGFFSKHGADVKALPKSFVSGHIHKEMEAGNVWHMGAPRWLSKSDANQQRGIWSVEVKDQKIVNKTFISSEDVSPAFLSVSIEKESDLEKLAIIDRKNKVYVQILSDDSLIKKVKELAPNSYVSFIGKTRTKTQIESSVSEKKGFKQSILDYVDSMETKTNAKHLKEEIERRLNEAN